MIPDVSSSRITSYIVLKYLTLWQYNICIVLRKHSFNFVYTTDTKQIYSTQNHSNWEWTKWTVWIIHSCVSTLQPRISAFSLSEWRHHKNYMSLLVLPYSTATEPGGGGYILHSTTDGYNLRANLINVVEHGIQISQFNYFHTSKAYAHG